MYKTFLDALRKDFDLSDSGELTWLLGCKVEQSPGRVRLHQEKYCNDVLKRFQMSDCNPVSTPCEANMHLTDADCPPLDKRNPEVVRDYQMCIGALMYLTCFTRGDCSFAVTPPEAKHRYHTGPISGTYRLDLLSSPLSRRGVCRRDRPSTNASTRG